jgi:Flp pilus assembly protein TadG
VFRPICIQNSRIRGRRPATAIVEFALAAVVVVPLMIGAFGFGEVLTVQQAVDAAAQEAAHVAASIRADGAGDTAARNDAQRWAERRVRDVLVERKLLPFADVEVSGDFSRGREGSPGIVTVRVRYTYRLRFSTLLLERWFPL